MFTPNKITVFVLMIVICYQLHGWSLWIFTGDPDFVSFLSWDLCSHIHFLCVVISSNQIAIAAKKNTCLRYRAKMMLMRWWISFMNVTGLICQHISSGDDKSRWRQAMKVNKGISAFCSPHIYIQPNYSLLPPLFSATTPPRTLFRFLWPPPFISTMTRWCLDEAGSPQVLVLQSCFLSS